MPTPDSLNLLDDLQNYRRLFTDAAFFRPAVAEICRRHGLAPCEHVRVGVPGTCPVFILEERWLVKLFGRLFDGEHSFIVESAAARMLAGNPDIPTPALLAAGQLDLSGVEWPWPYLVFTFIPGVSLGEVRAQVGFTDQLALARQMGAWVRALHALPLPPSSPFDQDWSAYLARLAARRAACAARHAAWGSLPPRLVDQIDAYLLPAADLLLPGETPHLIHADLTEDHLLGRLADGRWTSLALIDFGDAFTGSLFYELGPLHLSLFAADRRLLAAFLQAYAGGRPLGDDFVRRAMSCALLHEFNVLEILDRRADLRAAGSLEQLSAALWSLD